MNVFIAIAALMTLLVVAWLLFPLLRNKAAGGVSAERLNIDIHRDQLRALEADLARGTISPQDFEATRDELQLRLLDDTESFEAPLAQSQGFWTPRRTAAVIAVCTPALAVALYLQIGTPEALNPAPSANASAQEQQIQQMVDKLAAKLAANPDNPPGWAMLARSYRIMGRLEESRQAFEKAGAFVDSDPDILLDYAALLGAQNGNTLNAQANKMIDAALKLKPEHPTGLMMSGISAYQRGDFAAAVSQWEKLLGLLEPGSEDAQQVQGNIADARAQGKLPASANDSAKLPPVPAGTPAGGMTPEMINQMVERLATRLKDNPQDYAGQARLANAYKVQGKLDLAAQTYAKAGPLLDTDASLMTQYADLLVLRAKGDFKGQPQALISKALSLDPQQPTALMMAGQAAFQAKDYPAAIRHWENVLKVLPAGSSDSTDVKAEIADAKSRMGAAGKP
jgi:cytochrome c-type biogenesis protein CcmH